MESNLCTICYLASHEQRKIFYSTKLFITCHETRKIIQGMSLKRNNAEKFTIVVLAEKQQF